jgi:opacity protein-like surface antigen
MGRLTKAPEGAAVHAQTCDALRRPDPAKDLRRPCSPAPTHPVHCRQKTRQVRGTRSAHLHLHSIGDAMRAPETQQRRNRAPKCETSIADNTGSDTLSATNQVESVKNLVLASVLTLCAIGAQAQVYGELGYTSLSTKELVTKPKLDDLNTRTSPKAIRGIVGYELTPNITVEGMIAIGMGNVDVDDKGKTIPLATYKVQNILGLYIKPKFKVVGGLEVFVRAGLARTQREFDIPKYDPISDNELNFSYGAGLRYSINPTASLNVDYMQYLNKVGLEINGLTVGIGMKF